MRLTVSDDDGTVRLQAGSSHNPFGFRTLSDLLGELYAECAQGTIVPVEAATSAFYKGQLRVMAPMEQQPEAALPSDLGSLIVVAADAMQSCFREIFNLDKGEHWKQHQGTAMSGSVMDDDVSDVQALQAGYGFDEDVESSAQQARELSAELDDSGVSQRVAATIKEASASAGSVRSQKKAGAAGSSCLLAR